MQFQAAWTPLCASHPEWGEAACLPWDEAIFGFPVAELRGWTEAPPRAALEEFARSTGGELIASRVPAEDTARVMRCCAEGFVPVDVGLQVTLARLRPDALPKPRFGVRRAKADDLEALVRMAESAFSFGRYHGDPRFPRDLANRRYAAWVRNAFAAGGEHLFVLGQENERLGFHHSKLDGETADLRLAAADPARIGVGVAVISEVMLALAELGATQCSSRISAANVAVMNVYASLGFRFAAPEMILHWHAPGAAHLL